jgi:large subunit ribosomal protein L25
MKTIDLKAELREALGKKAAKAIRREAKIPVILYGRNTQPTPLAVSRKEFHRVTHTKAGGNVLVTLKMEGAKAKKDTTCLIKEVQRDPVTDEIFHVDFAAISLTEKIRVKVPLSIKDLEQAVGIKEGGVLDLVHHEIEVECLPTEIPERLEASVKHLKIGEAIHLKELEFPPNVNPLLEADEVVIALHPPLKEAEVAPPAEAASEPEVIEKGKKEKPEEGAEAAPLKAEKPQEKAAKAEKSEKPEKSEKK